MSWFVVRIVCQRPLTIIYWLTFLGLGFAMLVFLTPSEVRKEATKFQKIADLLEIAFAPLMRTDLDYNADNRLTLCIVYAFSQPNMWVKVRNCTNEEHKTLRQVCQNNETLAF